MSDWYPGGAEWDECTPEDVSYMYVNPDVTKVFKILDGEEVDKEKEV